ncbi:MAG: GDYXXLXY domain-containing protein [Gammaproteobacteria bacterium]|nr:GDYXXLXY domain-containing protein [Gammaproteobacteria bacterium]MBU1722335.1 GDYXXLXY domain-containing protein [Gammaproteobacteria bacterium]MBU2004728.1 GDYXXLXY domain-containing protein [Gammaproteobacteria bacterium]
MNKRILLLTALILPILALMASAYLKSAQRSSGEQVILPIEGFDPRDLLSGHYLIYQVDYGLETGCTEHDVETSICLRPQRQMFAADALPEDCTLFIRGYCDGSADFRAGIERFYIPEEYAEALEKQVRDKRGELVLSVDSQGNAAIRDLLINGKPWQETVQP